MTNADDRLADAEKPRHTLNIEEVRVIDAAGVAMTTRYVVDGKPYASLDDLPPELRVQARQAAAASHSAEVAGQRADGVHPEVTETRGRVVMPGRSIGISPWLIAFFALLLAFAWLLGKSMAKWLAN